MHHWHYFGRLARLCTFGFLLALPCLTHSSNIVPPQIVQQPVTPATAGDLLYYESAHDLDIGDKGEESFDLSVKAPACGEQALVFHQARVVYKRKRFGEARIAQSPTSGCTRCSPLVVRWYHEPTGHVDFQVHVYRKRVEGSCPS